MGLWTAGGRERGRAVALVLHRPGHARLQPAEGLLTRTLAVEQLGSQHLRRDITHLHDVHVVLAPVARLGLREEGEEGSLLRARTRHVRRGTEGHAARIVQEERVRGVERRVRLERRGEDLGPQPEANEHHQPRREVELVERRHDRVGAEHLVREEGVDLLGSGERGRLAAREHGGPRAELHVMDHVAKVDGEAGGGLGVQL